MFRLMMLPIGSLTVQLSDLRVGDRVRLSPSDYVTGVVQFLPTYHLYGCIELDTGSPVSFDEEDVTEMELCRAT